MAGVRRFFCTLGVLLLAGPVFAAPLEAYGKLPSIEDGSVSASGTQLALVVTNGEERRVAVEDVATGKVTFVGGLGTAKVRDVRWAGDQHLIITNSVTTQPNSAEVEADRGEYFFASDLDLKAGKLHSLLHDAGESMNIIEGLPLVRMVDSQPTVFLEGIHFLNSQGSVSLFRIEVAHDTSKLLYAGGAATRGFVVGSDGKPLAEERYDAHTARWSLRTTRDGLWHEIVSQDDVIDPPDVLGLGRDGETLLVNLDDKGWREIGVDGKMGEPIAAVDGQSAIHDPATGKLIGHTELVGDERRVTFFDPADERAWKAVEKAFPDNRLSLVAWSNDRTKILITADSPTKGLAYALVDLTARSARWLGDQYQGLTEADIGPVKAVNYKAADGFALTGYLTLPRGKDPKNLPLVVFPHGGPASRDEPGFDWWAQAMASRGYAVLQVNFRGSTGFGWDYMQAGFGQWGRKMQTDLSDGVRYLAGQGTIDPKRVCIVGGSYGGYAALAGATLDKGVYRCAVSFGGVSDLRKLIVYDRNRGGGAAVTRYWDRFVGAKDLDDPVLAKYSPLAQAAQADIPILLIHGKDDTVVPLDQSTRMADALRKAGKPVELIVQNNADHWLSLGATRLSMLQATMAFVEKNNPPD
ncbi:MAG: S9 family peptidase [Phenylobacterium sp.]|nr:MAG: S9 family peptidase [Phenylobacterium sp.]